MLRAARSTVLVDRQVRGEAPHNGIWDAHSAELPSPAARSYPAVPGGIAVIRSAAADGQVKRDPPAPPAMPTRAGCGPTGPPPPPSQRAPQVTSSRTSVSVGYGPAPPHNLLGTRPVHRERHELRSRSL